MSNQRPMQAVESLANIVGELAAIHLVTYNWLLSGTFSSPPGPHSTRWGRKTTTGQSWRSSRHAGDPRRNRYRSGNAFALTTFNGGPIWAPWHGPLHGLWNAICWMLPLCQGIWFHVLCHQVCNLNMDVSGILKSQLKAHKNISMTTKHSLNKQRAGKWVPWKDANTKYTSPLSPDRMYADNVSAESTDLADSWKFQKCTEPAAKDQN